MLVKSREQCYGLVVVVVIVVMVWLESGRKDLERPT